MDVDLFVQYLNNEEQSVIKGLRHFNSNMSEASMKRLMKNNGYNWSSIDRTWNKTIHTTSSILEKNSETTSHEFTSKEIEALKSLINNSDPIATGLIGRIKDLPKDDKVRKTIVISQSVGDKLDEFCKVKRVQKSSVLELAIEDIISRYE